MKKTTTYLLTLSTLIACSNMAPIGMPGNEIVEENSQEKINWPQQYKPEKATFYVHNEIDIAAPPEIIWEILIRAEEWPTWYEGALDVDVIDSDSGVLEANSAVNWRTMGFEFTSEIKEFEPPYRLSWESKRRIIQGYHAWLIIPTPAGSKVITDESQFGLLARMQPIFVPNKLKRLHDVWLAELKIKAEKRAR